MPPRKEEVLDPLNEAQEIVNLASDALTPSSNAMQPVLDKATGTQVTASQAYEAAKATVSQAGQTVVGAAEGAVQAVQRAAEAARAKAGVAAEAGKLERAVGLRGKGEDKEEEVPPPRHDEVDASPNEQLFRHHVEWELHTEPGPLQRAKEATVHAAEGAKHRIEGMAERLHLTRHAMAPSQQGQQGQQQAGGSSGLRMAKAEGRGGCEGEGQGEEGPPPVHDEVDASPEEQFVRHHIRWPEQQAGEEGALHHIKEKVVHAAEGVVHRIEGAAEKIHILPHHPAQQEQQGKAAAAPAAALGATTEQRTGDPLHKAAEGRNEAQDDPVVHTLHAALRQEPAERAEGVVNAFPETLGDAIKAAGAKGEDDSSTSAVGGGSGSSVDINSNPFSSTARSKL